MPNEVAENSQRELIVNILTNKKKKTSNKTSFLVLALSYLRYYIYVSKNAYTP